MNKFPNVDGETAKLIAMDVGNGIDPDDSAIDYGPEELAFRKQIEKELVDFQKIRSDAEIQVAE